MISRQSSGMSSKIPAPSVTQGATTTTALPRPTGIGFSPMKSNTSPPQDNQVQPSRETTPQSSNGSHHKDMDSWDERRFSRGDSEDRTILTEDTDSFIIGDVVFVGGQKRGKIAFIGETQFAKGDWAGIVLDQPVGKNDGMVSGIRYFQCDPLHGTFTRLTRLTRQPLPPYDNNDDCFVHGNTPPPRYLGDYRRSPSPFSRSKSPSPGQMTPRGSSPAPIKLGERVIVQSSSGTKRGILRFIGNTMFAPGEWAGIELDQPIGKNDGSVGVHRYFSCPDRYGLFAPVQKVFSSPTNRLTPNLRRHGSRESMSSFASSSAPRPLRSVLQEKEKHLEQLLKERDMDMNEAASANRLYEDRIQELIEAKNVLQQNQEESKIALTQAMNKMEQLEQENEALKISLEEVRKEHEDLLFTYEEEKINQADFQSQLAALETDNQDGTENKEVASLRLIINQYSEKLKSREEELTELKEKLSKQNKQIEASVLENKDHLETINKLQQQLDENQKKIRDMEENLAAEIVHSQHAIAVVEHAHKNKIEELSKVFHKVNELSSSLMKATAECSTLEAQKSSLEDELNHIILSKTVDPGLLESRLKAKEEESTKLQERIKELQQLNESLTSVWQQNVIVIQDSFKKKETELEHTIQELEEKLKKQTETTENTIENLKLQLHLK